MFPVGIVRLHWGAPRTALRLLGRMHVKTTLSARIRCPGHNQLQLDYGRLGSFAMRASQRSRGRLEIMRTIFPAVRRNVRLCTYGVLVNEYTLLPDLPRAMRRYHVTVTLPRLDGNEALVPAEGQAVIELTAAAILAEGLLTAWTSTKSVVSMVVELPSVADALEAGVTVARVLQASDGTASVTAEPIAP